jgi:hypothetical protein
MLTKAAVTGQALGTATGVEAGLFPTHASHIYSPGVTIRGPGVAHQPFRRG